MQAERKAFTVMDEGAWRRRSCRLLVELSSSEWSVFINLEPLSCQKERVALAGGEQIGGGETLKAHLHTISLFIFSLAHTHTLLAPPAPPPKAGQFTVRPFNFPEIGLWQLCHADEKVLRRVAACHISSISAHTVLNFCCLHLSSFRFTSSGMSHFFSSNECRHVSLLNLLLCKGRLIGDWHRKSTKVISGSCFLSYLHRLLWVPLSSDLAQLCQLDITETQRGCGDSQMKRRECVCACVYETWSKDIGNESRK